MESLYCTKDYLWVRWEGKWYNPDEWKNYEKRKQIYLVPDDCFHQIEKVLAQAEKKIAEAPLEKKQEYIRRYFKFSKRVRDFYLQKIKYFDERRYRYR